MSYLAKRGLIILLIIGLLLSGCNTKQGLFEQEPQVSVLVQPEGTSLAGRFLLPAGYQRIAVEEHSFAAYLRNLPLKPHGSKVLYYNGESKSRDVYEAVIDLDVGTKDLQQCADAVIRLRAEYLFQEQRYDQIHFNFTNGFVADYPKWREGYRIKVQGNSVAWVKNANYSAEYQEFRKYLDTVFTYAGTLSLAQELTPVKVEEMQIGDVFIRGGSPGHCVIVVDMAQQERTGAKLFMLAQGYMPAQDIQILKNSEDKAMSPWYSADFVGDLKNPEWTFTREDLKRFRER